MAPTGLAASAAAAASAAPIQPPGTRVGASASRERHGIRFSIHS
jgi:hypothetical protein